ncbi:MAG: CDP-alcohol phosphatidyltransferase family protein [Bacteroidales bacterium]|nr:CDP-alcohol phosphatidyltransferase family protein [Bacteroidales bacterium]
MKKYLPDLLTLLNLMCGVCASVLAAWGFFWQAFCFILAGAVFDMCDGALARALGVSSGMGRELDSLSDLVSFGVAPALMMFSWYYKINCGDTPHFLAFVPLLIVPFSAVRLARFNLFDSGEKTFRGLPTPASAMIAAGLVAYGHCCAIAGAESLVLNLLRSAWFIPVVAAILCILLVSRIRMFSIKEKPGAKHFILAAGALIFVALIAFVAPRGILLIGYLALFLVLLFTAYILLAIIGPKE